MAELTAWLGLASPVLAANKDTLAFIILSASHFPSCSQFTKTLFATFNS
jgi:hypothetical protein